MLVDTTRTSKILGLLGIINNIEFAYGNYGQVNDPGYVVLFDGNIHCNVIVIGEALGKSEKQVGRIFIGQSGQVLRSLLSDIGCYLGFINMLFYRPYQNTTPLKSDVMKNSQTIDGILSIIKPKIALVVGRVASAYLSLVSSFHFEKIVHVYHPAYYLRLRDEKILNNIKDGISQISILSKDCDICYLLLRKLISQ